MDRETEDASLNESKKLLRMYLKRNWMSEQAVGIIKKKKKETKIKTVGRSLKNFRELFRID